MMKCIHKRTYKRSLLKVGLLCSQSLRLDHRKHRGLLFPSALCPNAQVVNYRRLQNSNRGLSTPFSNGFPGKIHSPETGSFRDFSSILELLPLSAFITPHRGFPGSCLTWGRNPGWLVMSVIVCGDSRRTETKQAARGSEAPLG